MREAAQEKKELRKDVAPGGIQAWPDPQVCGALEREAHGSAEPMKQGDRLSEGISACDLPPGCKFWDITS